MIRSIPKSLNLILFIVTAISTLAHGDIMKETRVIRHLSVFSDTVREHLGHWPREWEDYRRSGIDLSVLDHYLGSEYRDEYTFVSHDQEIDETGMKGRILLMRKSPIGSGNERMWPAVIVRDDHAWPSMSREDRMREIIKKYGIDPLADKDSDEPASGGQRSPEVPSERLEPHEAPEIKDRPDAGMPRQTFEQDAITTDDFEPDAMNGSTSQDGRQSHWFWLGLILAVFLALFVWMSRRKWGASGKD